MKFLLALETNKIARVIVNIATQRESRSKRECGGGEKGAKKPPIREFNPLSAAFPI
ncbi:MAG: hypothetical protein GQ523_09345 [Methanophagales archaeon]|nr:hypothetical protein [Methanophagales archaeon]